MSILKFIASPNPQAATANMIYICRDSACERLEFYNLDGLKSENLREEKINARSFAEEINDDELKKRGTRNHFRAVFSFDRKEVGEVAAAEVRKFIEKEFLNSRAVISIHNDTEHTHAHVWISIRDTKNKKIQIKPKQYKNLDIDWAIQYDDKYKTNYATGYFEKKTITNSFKKNVFEEEGKTKGKKDIPINKPSRLRDKTTAEFYRNLDNKKYGVSNEEGRIRTNKRRITNQNFGVGEANRKPDLGKRIR
jgi:glutamate synthase domain-containing protein 2